MSARASKFTLTLHIICSVGWLGAVLAYLPFAIEAFRTPDSAALPELYRSMNRIGWWVIVPCGVGALVTGIVQSLVTPWGLWRYYWVLAKLFLTVIGVTVLLLHMPLVSQLASGEVRMPTINPTASLMIHAAGGLLLLSTITAISVLKPWGLTSLGLRRQAAFTEGGDLRPGNISVRGDKMLLLWVCIALLILVGLVLSHLASGPFRHH